MAGETPSTWFQRYLLPGFAFKAVVIGGGYATGRELAEFFLSHGPLGGVAGMLLAMSIWAAVAALTFLFAYANRTYDYRSFFRALAPPLAPAFEVVYVLLLIVILAVFGASAGAIGAATLGWPPLAGTALLIASIAWVVAFGSVSVERLFKWVSYFLYAVYALFVVAALSSFGDRVEAAFAQSHLEPGWASGGLTYAGYNIVGAVVVLPVARHFRSGRDALCAGLIAGPLAMLPALLFFVCMTSFYPAIATEALPSDYLLRRLPYAGFHFLFQAMVFLALLESGSGALHAVNERIAAVWKARRGVGLAPHARLPIALAILVCSMGVADRFGLVTLIARGYTALSYALLAVYVLPLCTLGLWRLYRVQPSAPSST